VIVTGTTVRGPVPGDRREHPVDKAAGDPVFAGTINTTGTFEARVTSLANGTLYWPGSSMQSSRPRDRARPHSSSWTASPRSTPLLSLPGLGGVPATPWLMDWTWMQAIYKALVLLVIACPCALVISTPVTVVSGLAAAARRGILIKGGVHLEDARKIKAIAWTRPAPSPRANLNWWRPKFSHRTMRNHRSVRWAARPGWTLRPSSIQSDRRAWDSRQVDSSKGSRPCRSWHRSQHRWAEADPWATIA
jgi:hypothetical protein